MSALCLQLITVLCLSCTALSGQESGGVVWVSFGGAITIQCRTTEPDQENLTLKRGLTQDEILVIDSSSEKNTINKEFRDRLQLNGIFPNVDITIQNLTSNDSGPFWCCYTKIDKTPKKVMETKGIGSVLLVVKDDTEKQCDPASKDLVLVSVVIIGVVLLVIIMGFLIWIIYKTKTLRRMVKPRHTTTNDVYEDMRGTLRHSR